jgi:hypothetical protein
MATDVLDIPENLFAENKYVLRDEIPALQLIAIDNGRARWGPMIRLPRGAELHDFGQGFDEQTMRVRYDGCFYIIFQEDLEKAQRVIEPIKWKKAQTA